MEATKPSLRVHYPASLNVQNEPQKESNIQVKEEPVQGTTTPPHVCAAESERALLERVTVDPAFGSTGYRTLIHLLLPTKETTTTRRAEGVRYRHDSPSTTTSSSSSSSSNSDVVVQQQQEEGEHDTPRDMNVTCVPVATSEALRTQARTLDALLVAKERDVLRRCLRRWYRAMFAQVHCLSGDNEIDGTNGLLCHARFRRRAMQRQNEERKCEAAQSVNTVQASEAVPIGAPGETSVACQTATPVQQQTIVTKSQEQHSPPHEEAHTSKKKKKKGTTHRSKTPRHASVQKAEEKNNTPASTSNAVSEHRVFFRTEDRGYDKVHLNRNSSATSDSSSQELEVQRTSVAWRVRQAKEANAQAAQISNNTTATSAAYRRQKQRIHEMLDKLRSIAAAESANSTSTHTSTTSHTTATTTRSSSTSTHSSRSRTNEKRHTSHRSRSGKRTRSKATRQRSASDDVNAAAVSAATQTTTTTTTTTTHAKDTRHGRRHHRHKCHPLWHHLYTSLGHDRAIRHAVEQLSPALQARVRHILLDEGVAEEKEEAEQAPSVRAVRPEASPTQVTPETERDKGTPLLGNASNILPQMSTPSPPRASERHSQASTSRQGRTGRVVLGPAPLMLIDDVIHDGQKEQESNAVNNGSKGGREDSPATPASPAASPVNTLHPSALLSEVHHSNDDNGVTASANDVLIHTCEGADQLISPTAEEERARREQAVKEALAMLEALLQRTQPSQGDEKNTAVVEDKAVSLASLPPTPPSGGEERQGGSHEEENVKGNSTGYSSGHSLPTAREGNSNDDEATAQFRGTPGELYYFADGRYHPVRDWNRAYRTLRGKPLYYVEESEDTSNEAEAVREQRAENAGGRFSNSARRGRLPGPITLHYHHHHHSSNDSPHNAEMPSRKMRASSLSTPPLPPRQRRKSHSSTPYNNYTNSHSGRYMRGTTRSCSPLGFGRLNPYCAVCRTRFNFVLVNRDMCPVRYTSPRRQGRWLATRQLGECRWHGEHVFGSAVACEQLIERTTTARNDDEEEEGGGDKAMTRSFMRAAQPAQSNASPDVEQEVREKTAGDEDNTSAHSHHHTSSDEEEARRAARLRRGERRLRRRMKQLLWHDLPASRDRGSWDSYVASLREGLQLMASTLTPVAEREAEEEDTQ